MEKESEYMHQIKTSSQLCRTTSSSVPRSVPNSWELFWSPGQCPRAVWDCHRLWQGHFGHQLNPLLSSPLSHHLITPVPSHLLIIPIPSPHDPCPIPSLITPIPHHPCSIPSSLPSRSIPSWLPFPSLSEGSPQPEQRCSAFLPPGHPLPSRRRHTTENTGNKHVQFRTRGTNMSTLEHWEQTCPV